MNKPSTVTTSRLLSTVAIGALLGLAGAVLWPTAPAKAQKLEIPGAAQGQDRSHVFAPWSPDRIGEVRKKFGLVGPGSNKPYPEPRFPKSLRAPNSVEDMMPGARAAVAQTSGRSPIGLVKRGEHVLIVVPYNANPFVQEAMQRAFKERGVTVTILYEHDAAGVAKDAVASFYKAQIGRAHV